jgi:hypothetical protein
MATRTRPSRSRPRRPRPAPSPPRTSVQHGQTGFDRDYWLAHCEGYRVDAADGRLGFVEAVRRDGSRNGPLLAVRAGRLGRRLLLVPASEVAFIVPRAEQIWLASPVRIARSEAA